MLVSTLFTLSSLDYNYYLLKKNLITKINA